MTVIILSHYRCLRAEVRQQTLDHKPSCLDNTTSRWHVTALISQRAAQGHLSKTVKLQMREPQHLSMTISGSVVPSLFSTF